MAFRHLVEQMRFGRHFLCNRELFLHELHKCCRCPLPVIHLMRVPAQLLWDLTHLCCMRMAVRRRKQDEREGLMGTLAGAGLFPLRYMSIVGYPWMRLFRHMTRPMSDSQST